jgi:hypothetical protein
MQPNRTAKVRLEVGDEEVDLVFGAHVRNQERLTPEHVAVDLEGLEMGKGLQLLSC